MKPAELHQNLASGAFDKQLRELYGADEIESQKNRYLKLLDAARLPANTTPFFVSVPGRTELGGNHTDHNHGRVLAAAINRDCVGLVVPSAYRNINISSEAAGEDIRIDLARLDPRYGEQGRAQALVRGVAASWMREHRWGTGFNAVLDNQIPVGGGLSSSAAFGALVGAALSQANGQQLERKQLARFAHEAENRYFGKPCGLMDQLSCSLGGVLAIDFANPQEPHEEKIAIDLARFGYRLLLIDTGSSHAALTADYAAIPKEMRLVASKLGVACGREISLETLLARLPEIREATGDRPLLRMLHFLREDQRATSQAEALRRGDFAEFLRLTAESGDSSWRLLQNCLTSDSKNQPVALGIVLSQIFCPQAVARVHGGGFAGTIQVWVPEQQLTQFTEQMEHVFGAGSIIDVAIGRPGITIIGGLG